MFITTKIASIFNSSPTVHRYDFHIFEIIPVLYLLLLSVLLKLEFVFSQTKVFNLSTEFVTRRHIEFSKITPWNTTGSCSTLTSNVIRQVVCGSSFLWQAYDRIWPAFIFPWLKQNDDFINSWNACNFCLFPYLWTIYELPVIGSLWLRQVVSTRKIHDFGERSSLFRRQFITNGFR